MRTVTATTTRRTCALAFAAILPFTALPAVQAAPQTTQTMTSETEPGSAATRDGRASHC